MTYFFKKFRSVEKCDFTAKVLDRYNSRKVVSKLARDLFRTEDAASINERFAQARRKVSA